MGLVEEIYPHVLEMALEMGKTSSIINPLDQSVTFARNNVYLNNLIDVRYKNILVLLPYTINREIVNKLTNNIYTYILNEGDSVEYVWSYIHNKINEHTEAGPVIIGEDCNISEHAIMGISGNTYCVTPEGRRLHLKEIGGVKIGDRVTIGAQTLVHRSCFGNTIIENDVVICVKCNIGHNSKIGAKTYIGPGVLLGGGTEIGTECFIWQGVITHSQIKICDRVIVGNASYVHRNITESGIYAGIPTRYIKPFDEKVLKGEVRW